MAPRPRWWHQLQASKNELLLAVDLYNRSGRERQLEAFIVHTSMGWLKLFQSKGEHDGHDLYIRDDNGRRVRGQNRDWLLKPLHTLTREMLTDNDPRRRAWSSSPACVTESNTAMSATSQHWLRAERRRGSWRTSARSKTGRSRRVPVR